MSHTIATKAFSEIEQSTSVSLLAQLYAALVTLELLAKDRLVQTGSWIAGHNVVAMLNHIDGTLAPLSIRLSSNLCILICTSRDGRGVPVDPAKYPDLRYLRHDGDQPAWPQSTTDAALKSALGDARQCLQQLKTLGIHP